MSPCVWFECCHWHTDTVTLKSNIKHNQISLRKYIYFKKLLSISTSLQTSKQNTLPETPCYTNWKWELVSPRKPLTLKRMQRMLYKTRWHPALLKYFLKMTVKYKEGVLYFTGVIAPYHILFLQQSRRASARHLSALRNHTWEVRTSIWPTTFIKAAPSYFMLACNSEGGPIKDCVALWFLLLCGFCLCDLRFSQKGLDRITLK